MKFSIRDLLLVTVMVALVLGWWVDRTRLVKQANVTQAYKVVSEQLAQILQDRNPPTRLEISVNGNILETNSNDARGDFKLTVRHLPNSSAPAPNPPMP